MRVLTFSLVLFVTCFKVYASAELRFYDHMNMAEKGEWLFFAEGRIETYSVEADVDDFGVGGSVIGEDKDSYSYTAFVADGKLVRGFSDRLEFGVEWPLILSSNVSHQSTTTDNALSEDFSVTGLGDLNFFSRYRFVKRNGGQSNADLWFGFSPGVITPDWDTQVVHLDKMPTARGGNEFALGFSSGHKKQDIEVYLSFFYYLTGERERNSITAGEVVKISDSKRLLMALDFQWRYWDYWLMYIRGEFQKYTQKVLTLNGGGLEYFYDGYTQLSLLLSGRYLLLEDSFSLDFGIKFVDETGQNVLLSSGSRVYNIEKAFGTQLIGGISYKF